MSRLLAASLGLLVSVALAAHLETEFSISVPYPLSIYASVTAEVSGDGLYILGAGNVVETVNLTTRTNKWVSPDFTVYGSIYSMAVTSQAVLISFQNTIIALSLQTGEELWVQNGYALLRDRPTAFASKGTIYAQVILPTGYYALQSFDAATGTPGNYNYGNDLKIDGSTAFISQYSFNDGQVSDSTLRAVDIPTNQTLWTVPCADQGPAGSLIQVISSQYVAISNISDSGDEVAVVLHRKNGTVAQSFQAFNGFSNYGVASIHGNTLFALIGLEYERYVLADLTTGYITWTRSVGEAGAGGILSGTSMVSITYSLVLTVTPIGGNSPAISIPQVPSLPGPTIVDFGYGVVQVGNLQGYTLWDTKTGTFLGSNEQDPNAVLNPPLKWNGLSVVVSGNLVTAVKVVE